MSLTTAMSFKADDSDGAKGRKLHTSTSFRIIGLFSGLFLAMILFLSHLELRQSPSVSSDIHNEGHRRKLLDKGNDNELSENPLKILYTVTSLAEYNTGTRATVKGSDRLQETMIPVISEGVHSMLELGYQVDVFLVAHYIVQPERLQLIRDSLPDGVKLNYWDDAMPLGYDTQNYKENDGKSKIRERSLSLARQHRFVIRDHFLDYDIFVSFEDDMLISGHQVKHYVEMTNEIQRLKEAAPDDLPGNPDGKYYSSTFSGPMTKGQLSRVVPGFIRVEVLLGSTSGRFHTKEPPVPVDLVFEKNGELQSRTINPIPCCNFAKARSSPKRPGKPTSDQVMLWETEILPLGVRKMPERDDNQQSLLDWVALLRGPTYDGETAPNTIIGDYWAGSDGYFGKSRRPGGNARNLINNQGGWMATRQQIWEWHTKICPGGFLPPYEAPHFNYAGLDLRDVEWWSGGLHLFTKRHACNLQRVVSLDPDHFHLHLLYHTANNKQSSLKTDRFTRANDLLGQLNKVRKNAAAKLAAQ